MTQPHEICNSLVLLHTRRISSMPDHDHHQPPPPHTLKSSNRLPCHKSKSNWVRDSPFLMKCIPYGDGDYSWADGVFDTDAGGRWGWPTHTLGPKCRRWRLRSSRRYYYEPKKMVYMCVGLWVCDLFSAQRTMRCGVMRRIERTKVYHDRAKFIISLIIP